MVKINRIATQTGDLGQTSLGDGSRLDKDAPRVEAYGTLDEVAAQLGVARSALPVGSKLDADIQAIQYKLFDVGADLCVPGSTDSKARVQDGDVRFLDALLETWNQKLTPLDGFVLSAGAGAGAALHLARTVCRRAERRVLTLMKLEGDAVNPRVLKWLNRLSDVLFVMARSANADGHEEIWRPKAKSN